MLEPEGEKVLPARSTRGKRMGALLGEAAEADTEFWNQDFFADEARDLEYEKSESSVSVYDSDFDDREDHGDEDGTESSDDEERRERLRKKKKLLPPGRARPTSARRPKATKAAATTTDSGATTSRDTGRRQSGLRRDLAGHAEVVRKSSRSSAIEASLRHEELKRMHEVEHRLRKFKRESDSYTKQKATDVSMETLLTESCLITEVENAQSLNYLLEREEEAKRRHAAQGRKVYNGPKVKYRSFKDDKGLARNEYHYTNGAVCPRVAPHSLTLPAPAPAPGPGAPRGKGPSFATAGVHMNQTRRKEKTIRAIVESSPKKTSVLKIKIKPLRQ